MDDKYSKRKTFSTSTESSDDDAAGGSNGPGLDDDGSSSDESSAAESNHHVKKKPCLDPGYNPSAVETSTRASSAAVENTIYNSNAGSQGGSGSFSRLNSMDSSSDESSTGRQSFIRSNSGGGGGGVGGVDGVGGGDDSTDESERRGFGGNNSSDGGGSSSQKNSYDTLYSNTAMKMMNIMGYQKDKGLGKLGQGRIEPIEASEQKGRRGLGLKLDGLDNAADKFDPTHETVQLRETVDWLINNNHNNNDLDDFSMDELGKWLVFGTKKLHIDDEWKFIKPDILSEILKSKTVFDNLGADDMRRACTRSNPFETIRGSIFLNRAAVKMANMDSILDFMFTKPIDENGVSLVRDDDLLYFADVCAGPGGFSEYVLWRKGWQAKGFGFTLKSENDFKLHDFFAGHPETFDPFYGVKGDGNVFNPENIESLTKYVLAQTNERGVHFMMADGGFSVEGQENIQEILSKQLYLCQCLVSLGILRENGHFVCKLFDLFTPFSVGLVYLMYKCFKQICILKPNTSRPANSERYLVCKWKKPNTDTIYKHLFSVNSFLWKQRTTNNDCLELVPLSVMQNDELFFNYIKDSNNRIGRNQISGLLKVAAFCKDPLAKETRQHEIRKECLSIWGLPDRARKAPTKKSSDVLLEHLLTDWYSEKLFLTSKTKELNTNVKLYEMFHDIYDWHFVPLDNIDESAKHWPTFFMSRGGRDILMYGPNQNWTELRDVCIELSPNTLIYGEIARELRGEGRSQTVVLALHIIDGILLGGVDIRRLPLRKRLKMCEKFAMALNKPNKVISSADGSMQSFTAPITCKKLFAMRDFNSFFDRLTMRTLKDNKSRLGLSIRYSSTPSADGQQQRERFYVPRGLLFFNELKPNLQRIYTITNERLFFDKQNKNKFDQRRLKNPNEVYASFKSTFINRKLWTWQNIHQVDEILSDGDREDSYLYRVDFQDYINRKMNANMLK